MYTQQQKTIVFSSTRVCFIVNIGNRPASRCLTVEVEHSLAQKITDFVSVHKAESFNCWYLHGSSVHLFVVCLSCVGNVACSTYSKARSHQVLL